MVVRVFLTLVRLCQIPRAWSGHLRPLLVICRYYTAGATYGVVEGLAKSTMAIFQVMLADELSLMSIEPLGRSRSKDCLTCKGISLALQTAG